MMNRWHPASRRSRPRAATRKTAELLDGLKGFNGTELNIFATLAHHPRLLKRWSAFGGVLLYGGALPARERELLILRAGYLCRAPYEWGQHVTIGLAAGLTDEEIARVADGPDAAGWSADDAVLLRATDELHADSRIGDDTWAALAARWDEQQLIEVCMVVGQYHLVAMTLNSLGVEPETDDFPRAARHDAPTCAGPARCWSSGPARRPSPDPDAPMGNGRAIAVVAGRAGATVACADLDADAARVTAALVEAEGATAHVLTADVADADACAGLVEAAAAAMDGLDGLVCNVGIGAGMGMQGTTAEQWDHVFAVNVRSHFLLASARARASMPEGGSIVFISSVAGLTAGSRIPAYDASKAALTGLCRQVAAEGARKGIRANVVAPGPHRHACSAGWPPPVGRRAPRRRCRSGARARRGRWPSRWCSCSATAPATSPASCSPSTAGSPAAGADDRPGSGQVDPTWRGSGRGRSARREDRAHVSRPPEICSTTSSVRRARMSEAFAHRAPSCSWLTTASASPPMRPR